MCNPFPHHWQFQVKADLDSNVMLGILEKVPMGVPTTWQSRMVVVAKKSGKPRRTVDLSPLNKHCLRETPSTKCHVLSQGLLNLCSMRGTVITWWSWRKTRET